MHDRKATYPWWIAIAFCLATLSLLAAMFWMTQWVLRSERSEREAIRRTAHEENVRLALWRIDSALAPILAQEASRPFSAAPSSPYVKLSFQYAPNGELSSSPMLSPDLVSAPLMIELASRIPRKAILSHLPSDSTLATTSPSELPISSLNASRNTQPSAFQNSLQNNEVSKRSWIDFENRRGNVMTNNSILQTAQNYPLSSMDLPVPIMIPISVEGEMLLVRRIYLDELEYLQGDWLDWNTIQTAMKQLIVDLLPEAHIEMCTEPAVEDGSNLLASLPARLIAADRLVSAPDVSSATTWLLALAWTAVLATLLAVSGLVLASLQWNERRASFVTAVTHELRTPLTTFLMYTEMLTLEMVPDPKSQQQYLHTLRQEALRLEHLVENVLAYAKLERGRSPQSLERVSIGTVLDRAVPYLERRAIQSQRKLEINASDFFQFEVRANPNLVEQILLNLVDNACKYANQSSDPRILLLVEETSDLVSIGVRDFGPGFPPKGKWFRPFHKSAEEAARTAPGVGLGLSLCQRLANQMGGSLHIDSTIRDGACVWLRLVKLEVA